MDTLDKDWLEVIKAEPGQILKDWVYDGIRCLIMRGQSALCAYVGLPINHPLANFNHGDIPLGVHWGLNFSRAGRKDDLWPEGYYWYGWSYDHCDDEKDYTYELPTSVEKKRWTIPLVEKDMEIKVIYAFKKLAILAEKIKLKDLNFLIVNEG